jgi:hypothetical protein
MVFGVLLERIIISPFPAGKPPKPAFTHFICHSTDISSFASMQQGAFGALSTTAPLARIIGSCPIK